MYNSKSRPNIGLVVCGLEDDYSAAICRGVITAAEENDCNLVIFPGRYIDMEYETESEVINARHYNTVYSYASEKNLDFLIIPMGTLCVYFRRENIDSFLKSFGDIPKISLSIDIDGCSCIRYDCRPGVRSLMHHLIAEHGCTKIAFIAAQKGQPDSEERLDTYRESLEEHGIPFNEDLVTYGNFSEYCGDVIEELLIQHHFDVDAIFCANDATATAAYGVLSRCGLTPGKDIIVTGYDNLPSSASCVPSLTTIAANVSEIGYRAVLLGLEAMRTGKPIESLELPTTPIVRESCCGLSCFSGNNIQSDSNIVMNLDEIVSRWISSAAPEQQQLLTRLVNSRSRRFLNMLFNEITDPTVTSLSIESLISLFREFSLSSSVDSMSGSILRDFLTIIQTAAFNKVTDPEKEKQLYSLFVSLYRIAVSTVDSINYSLTHDTRRALVFANNISGHISSYGKDINLTLRMIVEYLAQVGVRNSYLYLEDQPVQINSADDIHPFEQLRLAAYQHGDEFHSFIDDPPVIDKYNLFNNEYVSDAKRRTVMLSPIFSSREQYGVVVCDLSFQHLSLFQTLIIQINSTIETAFLLSKLNRQLNETENENEKLSNIATRDALTGCYNRLGFFERAGSAIVSPLNHGRYGFIMFADVNCLKQINDKYHHDDGDRALCMVVDSFSECFGHSGIVGRIGGDEFVIVWITDDAAETVESVHKRAADTLKKYDDASDYPYHVSASIGVHRFLCSERLSLQELIEEADRLQYIDKAKMSKKVNKD